MNNSSDPKCQVLSEDALYEKNILLDRLKNHFNCYSYHNYGCGYTESNEWNPFIHAPTLDIVNIYKNQHCSLYNSIIDAVTGKICQYIEIYEIKDWDNPHRILHPIDLPCFALRYSGQSISSINDIIVLGEVTGFVYKKHLQSTNQYFNLKLINEDTPKYILDTSKSSNLLRFISNSSLGPLFSHKKLPPNTQLHTIYIDNWPHIIVTTFPGVGISNGDQLIADFTSLQLDNQKTTSIHPVYNGSTLKNEKKIIPVLGIPLDTPVRRVINGNEVVGKVIDFVEQNNDGLFVVNYPDGDYELYTRVALMINLLKEYLKDSKLEQLLVPLSDKTGNLVTRSSISDNSKVKKEKVKKEKVKKFKLDSAIKRIKSKSNPNKSNSSFSTDHHSSNKSIDKKSKSKGGTKRISSKSISIGTDIKTLSQLEDIPKIIIPRTTSKDSTSSILTRFRRAFIGDKTRESIEFYATDSNNNNKNNNNTTLNTQPTDLIEDELVDLLEPFCNSSINSINMKPETKSSKSSKRSGTSKIIEEVSFRKNSPQEVKEKVPLNILKEYCLDTLLELSRSRKNWRDCDNRKQFNFHFAKISNAKTMEELEPQFTHVFYKLYQYVDLTITGDKITFDAVSSCEKENPQLIDHLLELLTNIFSEED